MGGPARWRIPRAVRPFLVAGIGELLDEVAADGPPPTYVARDLLSAIDLACRDAGHGQTVDALLDSLRSEELTASKVTRRVVPGLEKLGTFEAGRWAYPSVDAILGLLERVYRIDWIDLPTHAAPSGPPTDVTPTPYAADVPLAAGDWTAHPKFGTGQVVQTLEDRIRVRFADGERTLRHRAVVRTPRVEAMSPEVAAARAVLDECLADFVAEWRALGHDPKQTFVGASIGKAGLHPRDLAQRCIEVAELEFGATLSRRTRALDDEHGAVQRVPDRLLHEYYESPAGVVAAVVSQLVRPSGTDDEEVAGLSAEVKRRLD